MPSPLQAAGAAAQPTNMVPLHADRFSSGLWTNRSALRGGATTALMDKYYSASRVDSIFGGYNAEISSRLTLVRRPGLSVYNSATFPVIQRFAAFRLFSTSAERIRILADTAGSFYDATGPNGSMKLWDKAAGAGKTTFLGVGNTGYAGDGVTTRKYVQSAQSWQPATSYQPGDYIVDSNNNLQWVSQGISCAITQVSTFGGGTAVSLFINPPQRFATNSVLTCSGLTKATFLNGVPLTVTFNPNLGIVTATTSQALPAFFQADSGTLNLAAPTVSGATLPQFDSNYGEATIDGGITWVNKGSAIQGWGIAAPTAAPTLNTSPLPPVYPGWTANTRFAAQGVVDEQHHIQVLTKGGTTGSAEPVWADSPYLATTSDGSCVWTNYGDVNWHGATAYQVGAVISVTFTYYVTSYSYANTGNQEGGRYEGNYQVPQQQQQPTQTTTPVTVTDFFSCTQAGTTGASQPAWANGLGTQVVDGGAIWTNTGASTTWAANIGPNANLSLATKIVDSNGNLQQIATAGTSGAAAPAWSAVVGATTTDGSCVWSCAGPYSIANTGSQTYTFAYGNYLSGEISNASPISVPITRPQNSFVNLQGACSADPQVDTIYIFRTAQNGSTQLLLDTIPQPPGPIWSYADYLPDTSLNVSWQASLNLQLTPPPAGATAPVYHLQRIFVAVQNVVYYSAGPDASLYNASGNSGFPPLNSFVLPSRIVRMWATALGLVVMTISDIYIILGSATASDPLYIVPFLEGTGLLSYDAFAVNNTTAYLITSSLQLLSLDPGAGVLEVGLPIADRIRDGYDADSTLAFHSQSSFDTALYAADGSRGWYRMTPSSAPESGMPWSTQAIITGGCSTVASLETSPGVRQLLVAPSTPGPILKRDPQTHTDNGTPFPVQTIFGSIVLAQSSQLAALHWITLESPPIGQRATLGVLLGEIGGQFETLLRTRQDPVNLPPALTLRGDRYHFSQNHRPVICRSLQLSIGWPAEDAASELFTFTLVSALRGELTTN